MNLSELIQQLQSIYESQSDLPVVDSDFFNVRGAEYGTACRLTNPVFCAFTDIPLHGVFVRIQTDR